MTKEQLKNEFRDAYRKYALDYGEVPNYASVKIKWIGTEKIENALVAMFPYESGVYNVIGDDYVFFYFDDMEDMLCDVGVDADDTHEDFIIVDLNYFCN